VALARNLDLVIVGADRADHAAVGRIDIAQPARCAERAGVHTRADIAGDACPLPDRFVMIKQGLGRFQQELDEALLEATFLLAEQRVAPDEAAGFVQLDRKAEPGLERGIFIGDVMAPVAIALLHPQRVERVIAAMF
jgi:hypothetical protein